MLVRESRRDTKGEKEKKHNNNAINIKIVENFYRQKKN